MLLIMFMSLSPSIPVCLKPSIMRSILCFFLILICFSPVHALAEGKEQLNSLYIPDGSMPLDVYARRSHKIERNFEEDEYLSFSMDLPRDWTERQFVSLKNFTRRGRLHGDLARFDGQSVGDSRSFFMVRSVELPREISASNWLMTYLLSNGYTLHSLTERGSSSFEAMYIIYAADNNQSLVVRSRGYISGPRIVLGEYVMPAELWEKEKDIQAYAVGSFKIQAQDQETIEDPEYYSYLEAVEFNYPKSWAVVKTNDIEVNALDLVLRNADLTRVSEGTINIHMASRRSVKLIEGDHSTYDIDLPGIVKKARHNIENRGKNGQQNFSIGDRIDSKSFVTDYKFDTQRSEIYEVRPVTSHYDTQEVNPVSHEFWLTLLVDKAKSRVFIITLYTPDRDSDLYSWAVNSRAYERILKTIQ